MSWTVTADAVMPTRARAASVCPDVVAAQSVSRESGTGRHAPTRPPGAQTAAPVEWPFDPGRDALCTLTSPLRLSQWR
jgi:hypothetical protein